MPPECPLCKETFIKVKIVGGAPYDVLFYDKYAEKNSDGGEDSEDEFYVEKEESDDGFGESFVSFCPICNHSVFEG